MRTKRALAFLMALVLSFATFTSDLATIPAVADSVPTYKVDIVDENGNALKDIKVQFTACDDSGRKTSLTTQSTTNGSGKATANAISDGSGHYYTKFTVLVNGTINVYSMPESINDDYVFFDSKDTYYEADGDSGLNDAQRIVLRSSNPGTWVYDEESKTVIVMLKDGWSLVTEKGAWEYPSYPSQDGAVLLNGNTNGKVTTFDLSAGGDFVFYLEAANENYVWSDGQYYNNLGANVNNAVDKYLHYIHVEKANPEPINLPQTDDKNSIIFNYTSEKKEGIRKGNNNVLYSVVTDDGATLNGANEFTYTGAEVTEDKWDTIANSLVTNHEGYSFDKVVYFEFYGTDKPVATFKNFGKKANGNHSYDSFLGFNLTAGMEYTDYYGHEFEELTDGNKYYAYNPTGVLLFVFKKDAPASYNIIYNNTKGVDIAEGYKTYTPGNQKDLPTGLEKPGYTFIGWVDENGEEVRVVPSDAIGDKTFTAKWSANARTYDVSINDWVYGENPAIPTTSQTNGDALIQNVTFTYSGKTFGNKSYGPSEVVPTEAGNYTVTATFAKNEDYESATDTYDFTISKRPINAVKWILSTADDDKEITESDNTIEYDGTTHNVSVSVAFEDSNVLEADYDKIGFQFNNGYVFDIFNNRYENHVLSKKDAGDYKSSFYHDTVLGEAKDNYYIAESVKTNMEWKISPKVVELSWEGHDVNNHGNEDRTGKLMYGYTAREYTLTAKVTNACGDDGVYVTDYLNGWGYTNKQTKVGTYTAKATKLNNKNYKLPDNATQEWEIFYHELPGGNLYGEMGENDWYISDVALCAPDPMLGNPYFSYKITEGNPLETRYDVWGYAPIIRRNDTAGTEINYYVQTFDGYVSEMKTAKYKIDRGLPTGSVNYGFTPLMEEHKWFYKGMTVLNVSASDSISGVKSIEYAIVENPDEEPEFKEYSPEWGIFIPANNDVKVIAKITDNAGNVGFATTGDVIVYYDSLPFTWFENYTKTTKEDKEIRVIPFDNTIKDVKLGDEVLERGEIVDGTVSGGDYAVSGNDLIVLSGEYLDGLEGRDLDSEDEAKHYMFAVSYNPLGEKFDQYKEYGFLWYDGWHVFYKEGDSLGLDANDTYFTINVYKQATNATIGGLNKIYDGTAVAPTFTTDRLSDETTEFMFEYKVRGAEDDTYSDAAPVNAGDYTARLTVFEDDNYYGTELTEDFTISRRNVTIETLSDSKVQGSADPAFRAVVRNAIEPVSAFAWRIVGNEAPGEYEISHTIAPSEAAYPNYTFTIIHGTFTITALPVEVVTLPGPTFTPVTITPVAATPVEAEEVEAVEEEAEEIVIEEPATPEAPEVEEEPTVEIEEEPVPEAVAERCIMHWFVLGLAVLYAAYATVRALQNKKELDGDEETANN